MAQYDGTVRINTMLDAQGFNDGIKNLTIKVSSLTDTVKGLAATWLALIMGQTAFNSIFSVFSQYNLMWSSMGQEVMSLNWAFQTLQGAWANLLATAIQPMIPYLIEVINWLTGLLQYITLIVAALFGMSQTVGNITKKTDMLASFDKINKIGQMGPAASPPPMTVPQDLLDKVNALKKALTDILNPILLPFIKAWQIWGDWIKSHPALVMTLVIALAAVALALWLVLTPAGLLTLLIIGLIALAVLLTLHWNDLGTTLNQFGTILLYTFTHPLDAIHDQFMALLLVVGVVIAGIILLIAGVPLAIIAGVIAVIAVLGILVTHFSQIRDFFTGLGHDIANIFAKIVNGIVDAINFIVNGINGVGDLLPGYKSISPVAHMAIPYLASGGVIQPNAPFLAMLGDQSSGKNIEAPESLLRQIVREEMGNQSVNINFTGSLAQLARILKPSIDKENVRTGNNMVKRTGQVPIV